MAIRQMGRGGLSAFVPNGDNRKDTAILLVGLVREHGLSHRSIQVTPSGFYVSDELADILESEGTEVEVPEEEDSEVDEEVADGYDPADYNIAQVKEFISEHPDLAEDVLASEESGENRATLVKWLNETIDASGNRAEKNEAQEKE